MGATVELKRSGEEITLSIRLTVREGTPMLDCEEQIREALDEGGRLATKECLQNFDTNRSPIQLGGIKLTSKGRVDKDY